MATPHDDQHFSPNPQSSNNSNPQTTILWNQAHIKTTTWHVDIWQLRVTIRGISRQSFRRLRMRMWYHKISIIMLGYGIRFRGIRVILLCRESVIVLILLVGLFITSRRRLFRNWLLKRAMRIDRLLNLTIILQTTNPLNNNPWYCYRTASSSHKNSTK